MRAPVHHAPEALLLDYATGALAEAPALVVASQLALDPWGRARLRELESIGGALLEELDPAPLSDGLMERALARLDEPPPGPAAVAEPPAPRDGLLLPGPLRERIGPDIEALPWRRVMPGLRDVELPLEQPAGDGTKLRLMRIEPGVRVLRHGHVATELTLVLQGAYRDGALEFARGDLQTADADTDHRPQAVGEETCLCLVSCEAPIRFTGRFGRLLNPFIKY